MASGDTDMLTQAIERNAPAVLSLPSAGMVRYYKSRFLRCDGDRVWLESVPAERALIESLIQSGEEVPVSFKSGTRKASFLSLIKSIDCNYRFFDTEGPLEAIEMIRPRSVAPMQRRTDYRVPVRPTDGFKIHLWRINEQVHIKDPPPDRCYMPAQVSDLSVGGVGVIFDERPTLVAEQRIRILLQQGKGEPMLLEGRAGILRKIVETEQYETGIQFQDLQQSLPGRQMLTQLTRIVQILQLQEAKRTRGLAG
jgi:hypothetical protein